jgi:hypothetical protein
VWPAEQFICEKPDTSRKSLLLVTLDQPRRFPFTEGETMDTARQSSFALKLARNADAPHGKRRVAADLRPKARVAHI